MPQHIRALIVIVCLAIAVFWFARAPITESSMTPENYKFRRNMWFLCVLVVFLSHNFWIYILLTAALMYYAGKRDESPFALYCMALFAVPALAREIPGFGVVNFLFEIDYIRLLSLTVLVPIALKLRSTRLERQSPAIAADICVAVYIVLGFFMWVSNDTLTNSLRMTFYAVTDIGLPYYVASRALTKFEDYREVAAALVVAMTVMAVIAAFETARYWLLYNGLNSALDVPRPTFRTYLTRGIGGLLRARATTSQPIVLGYLMMIGITLWTFISHETRYRKAMWLAVGALAAGIVASLSRGPWVGTAIALMVVICLGPGRGKRIVWSVGLGGLAFVAILMSPYGPRVLEYLPFVGSIETENVDYRVRLWQVSMEVVRLKPWFGDVYYLQNPILEQLRQGQGIIDIVNSYLQVMLSRGLVGLALFIAPFLAAIRAAWRLQRAGIANGEPHVERLGRTLLAVMIGIMVTIATVSSINSIPTLYWIVVGLCVGTTRAFNSKARQAHQALHTDQYTESLQRKNRIRGLARR
jgi:O-antigen ligase